MANDTCPCGSGLPFEECCESILIGQTQAPTAAALMRARYSAFAMADIDFLFKSAGPRVRREFDAAGNKKWAESAEWTGIEILSTEAGGEDDETGMVEFIAHYNMKDKVFDHHERAQFAKIKGEWRFIDGKIIGSDPIRREEPRIGRNDPCPCGSGLKYKKCCILKEKTPEPET